MSGAIDDSARIVNSEVGEAMIREHVTIHDSEVGDQCNIYERASVKKSRIASQVDINAGTYIENADISTTVQVGPNCSLVGVTHELDERGMTYQNDTFETIRIENGAFVGAGAVVSPGVTIGADTVISAGTTVTSDVGSQKIVLGSPPTQRVMPLAEWTETETG